MSFILDALKKSETERQQQSTAEFASVPSSSSNPNPARWLWALGLLLLVNFAVLIGILLKPSTPADPATLDSSSVAVQAASNSFEEQVADAIDNQPEPAPVQVATQTPAQSAVAPTPEPRTADRPTTNTQEHVTYQRSTVAKVPTIDELRLEGSLQIEDLHLDIHVFSEVPADRFVFINMNKYREGSKIAEGPTVREIRPDGVVLEEYGRIYLLPRE